MNMAEYDHFLFKQENALTLHLTQLIYSCEICGCQAYKFNYSVMSCKACRHFFKRVVTLNSICKVSVL